MHAVTVMIRKLDSVSVADFRAWWLNKHVPYSVGLLGATDYVILQADEFIDRGTGQWSSEVPYDGAAVYFFDSEPALKKALDYPKTPEHRAEVDAWLASTIVLSGPAVVVTAASV
jgi:hypothetical protein